MVSILQECFGDVAPDHFTQGGREQVSPHGRAGLGIVEQDLGGLFGLILEPFGQNAAAVWSAVNVPRSIHSRRFLDQFEQSRASRPRSRQ